MQLHSIGLSALQRLSAQDHIQLLTLNDLGSGFLHLVSRQVDQQVGHIQDGVIVVLTDGDGHNLTVLAVYNTVNSQGNGGPLILLDTAVVMGLQIGDLRILIQGIGLHIHTGGVHMRSADISAICQTLAADNGQQNALVPVVVVDLVTGLQIHTGFQLLKAVCLSGLYCPGSCLPFGLAGIHKGCVALAITFHFSSLLFGQAVVAVLGSKQQLLFQFFHRTFSFISFLLL